MTSALLAATPIIVVAHFLFAAWAARHVPAAGQGTRPVLLASLLALAWAAAGAVGMAFGGGVAAVDPAGLFLVDPFSIIMLLLISFLGAIILRFSVNYLDGDPQRGTFLAKLALALAAVSVLVTANHLLLLIAAWVATSAILHRLLVFRHERPRAIAAARKKFIFARTGDVLLALAIACLWSAFGSLRIDEILATAGTAVGTDLVTGPYGWAALFLAGAAVLKSAQFPTHGWLTEVMETPTPVSALLHAGIVNAGGFLLIRFADVMVMSPGVMSLLIVIGGFSALFGAMVMVTQTSVKGALAHSTVAQMGFMILQCGLGVFSAAALHLVAHSLYKAHAFLSSGRAVVAVSARKPAMTVGRLGAVGGLAAAIALYFGIGSLFGDPITKAPAILSLGVIFAAGLFVYLVGTIRTPGALAIALAVSGLGSLSYFVLQVTAAALLVHVVPMPGDPDAFAAFLMLLATGSFLVVALFQVGVFRVPTAVAEKAYVHLARGLYANAVNDRLIKSLRLRKSAPSA